MSVLDGPEITCLDRPSGLTLPDEASQSRLCCLIRSPGQGLMVSKLKSDAVNGPASCSPARPRLLRNAVDGKPAAGLSFDS